MLTLLSVPAGMLTFGQFIKKPSLAYRPVVSRVLVSEALCVLNTSKVPTTTSCSPPLEARGPKLKHR